MSHKESIGSGWSSHQLLINIHRFKGFLIGLVAMSFFSCSTLCVTFLKGSLNVFLLVFIRFTVMTVLSLIILIFKNIPLWPCTRKEILLTLFSSIVGTSTVGLQFYAFHTMHPANASAILYGYITFIAFFAWLFLKERFGVLEAGSILVTLTGVLLIAQPPFMFRTQKTEEAKQDDDLGGAIPALVTLIASLLSALAVVIFRAIGRDNIPTLKTLFYHSLFSVPIMFSVVTILQQWSVPCSNIPRLLAVIMGVASFLAVTFMCYALSLENAVYVGLATMNEVYVIFIADVLFFGLVVEWLNILGMLLILASSLAIIVKKIIIARNEEQYIKNAMEDSITRSNEI